MNLTEKKKEEEEEEASENARCDLHGTSDHDDGEGAPPSDPDDPPRVRFPFEGTSPPRTADRDEIDLGLVGKRIRAPPS